MGETVVGGTLSKLWCMLAITALPWTQGCGASRESSIDLFRQPETHYEGPLKVTKWNIVRMNARSVEIGAFVPYCENKKGRPRIEQVRQEHNVGRVILTMFVRYPPRHIGRRSDVCFGAPVSVQGWVKLGQDPRKLRLFDGKVPPRGKFMSLTS